MCASARRRPDVLFPAEREGQWPIDTFDTAVFRDLDVGLAVQSHDTMPEALFQDHGPVQKKTADGAGILAPRHEKQAAAADRLKTLETLRVPLQPANPRIAHNQVRDTPTGPGLAQDDTKEITSCVFPRTMRVADDAAEGAKPP